ncbi:uncharacterized protein DUF2846 [Acidovorax temperans]|uniref:Uncharacterized protein DUF2846 n=2 Tax=Acidovorax temperans TaxID=80878 RepID=A0A543L8D6_9BURK|nr:uncharacterized protein DUF2846 [Acidovorax temperans]HRM65143.1 DUF2846 domain-containing protein [Acidovorax temperans]HRM83990.1 DUF2846 domain-containing protein [Acidovorax temperans]
MTGCASVNMASKEQSAKAKEFQLPPEGQTGAYLYRNSVLGKALSKDLRVDGNCVGVSAPDVFFYTPVDGGKTRAVETESEFSPNKLELFFEAGKNYFMRQFIKVGLMVGGADLEQVTEAQGKADNAARQSSDCHAAAMTAQAKSKGGYASFFVASSS